MTYSRYAKIVDRLTSSEISRLSGIKGVPAPERRNFVISTLQTSDPTPTGKYAGWLMRLWANGTLRIEDMGESARETLVDFERVKAMGDKGLPEADRSILRYKTMGNLFEALQPFAQVDALSNKDNKRLDALKAQNETYSVDLPSGLKVIIPLTRFAAQFHGRGTKWCTSADHNNMFENYASKEPIVIFKLPDGQQFQGAMLSEEKMGDFDDASDLHEKADYLEFKNAADNDLSETEAKAIAPYISDIARHLCLFDGDWDKDTLIHILSDPSTRLDEDEYDEDEDEDEDSIRCQEEFIQGRRKVESATESLEAFRHYMSQNEFGGTVLKHLSDIEEAIKDGRDLLPDMIDRILTSAIDDLKTPIDSDYTSIYSEQHRENAYTDLLGGYFHMLGIKLELSDRDILTLIKHLPTSLISGMIGGASSFEDSATLSSDDVISRRIDLKKRLFATSVRDLSATSLIDLLTYYRGRDDWNTPDLSSGRILYTGNSFHSQLLEQSKENDSVATLMRKADYISYLADIAPLIKDRINTLPVTGLDDAILARYNAAKSIFCNPYQYSHRLFDKEPMASKASESEVVMFTDIKNIIGQAMKKNLSNAELSVVVPHFLKMMDQASDKSIDDASIFRNLKRYGPTYSISSLFDGSDISAFHRNMLLATIELQGRHAIEELTREQQADIAYSLIGGNTSCDYEDRSSPHSPDRYKTFHRAIGAIPEALAKTDYENIGGALALARLSSLFPAYTPEEAHALAEVSPIFLEKGAVDRAKALPLIEEAVSRLTKHRVNSFVIQDYVDFIAQNGGILRGEGVVTVDALKRQHP